MANDLLDNSMKETELGSLPADWSVVPIGDLATQVGSGVTPRGGRDSYLKDGVPLVRSQNVLMNRLDLSDVAYIGEDVHESMSRSSLHPSDLLLNITGASIGRVAVVPKSLKKANVNQHVCIIRLNGLCDPWFASFYLSTEMGQSQVLGSQYGTTRQGLNFGQVRQLRLPIPPLEEQQAIAHVLRTVQRAKEATEKVIAAARQLKQSLMRHLFTYGPVPVKLAEAVALKETEIGEIPEHWEVVELGEYARLATGGTPSRENTTFWNGGIPWVKTGEINYRIIETTEETISKEGLANSNARLFPAGTLLTAMYGQGVTRGRVGILGIEATTNQACAAIFPGEHLDRDFLYYTFVFGYERIREMGHGANQRNLSMSMLKTVMLGLPPISDQKQIAKLLLPIDRKLTIEENKLNALDTLFRTLLHHLMTGKVRVNELEFPAMKEGSP